MKTKKLFAFVVALLLTSAPTCIQALAADNSTQVYVTVANGTLMTACEPVTVTDTDGDGALTLTDAIYAVHEKSYDGGADAGYATANGDFGLYITKLWGVENGGSYGYYINNSMAMNLTEPIKNGDNVVVYLYTDTVGFSDAYSYFDVFATDTAVGGIIKLTLNSVSFDANFNPVSNPVSGAIITVDGEATAFTTGSDGTVAVTLPDAGVHTISAIYSSAVLVPPVCIATVAEAASGSSPNAGTSAGEIAVPETAVAETATDVNSPSTGDYTAIAAFVIAAVSMAAVTVLRRKGHDNI